MEPQFIYAECAACGHQYNYDNYRKLWPNRCLCGASNWKSRRYTTPKPKEPEMTNRENVHALDKQRMSAQEYEKYYKELREDIEKEILKLEPKRPALATGQVWKMDSTGDYYIVNVAYEAAPILVDIHSGSPMKVCGLVILYDTFTYIGMASDCVKVV